MGEPKQAVVDWLSARGVEHEVMHIDPELADTAVFCEHYAVPLENSANTILVASKKAPKTYAAGVVLSTTRLDVNKRMRSLMGVSRASFATAEEMSALTGMLVGGLTPFGLPADLRIYVDAAVMKRPWVVVGGGGRDTKVKFAPAVFETMAAVHVVDGLGLPPKG